MKILVAGAGGQLGQSLLGVLDGHEVVPTGRQQLDITRFEKVRSVLSEIGPELVINAAAWNRVDDAEDDPVAAYRTNALGPRNLAVAAGECGAALVHVSTDYVFDGVAGRPYHEFDRPNPQSAYGRSKLAGEEAVRALLPRHYVVRTAWLYGPTGANFPRTMLSVSDRPEVRVVNDQIGSPTWTPHLAEAIARLVETRAFGTYHMAGDGAASWWELTRALYSELGITTPVRPVSTEEFPRPAPRPPYSVLTTIQSPEIRLPPWKEGLRAFVECVRRETT